MNATGNFKRGDVTPAKLLGEQEPKPKRDRKAEVIEGEKMPVNEFFNLLQQERKGITDGTQK